MGYSCSTAASEKLDQINAHCVRSTGMSNVWKNDKGVKYFHQMSRTEHDCGKITGTIMRCISETHIVSAGGFCISGDGEIVRFPGLPFKKLGL